jgi:hypothetical protein
LDRTFEEQRHKSFDSGYFQYRYHLSQAPDIHLEIFSKFAKMFTAER